MEMMQGTYRKDFEWYKKEERQQHLYKSGRQKMISSSAYRMYAMLYSCYKTIIFLSFGNKREKIHTGEVYGRRKWKWGKYIKNT